MGGQTVRFYCWVLLVLSYWHRKVRVWELQVINWFYTDLLSVITWEQPNSKWIQWFALFMIGKNNLYFVVNFLWKDTEPPMDIARLGQCQAPWNPRTQLLLPSSTVKLSIPPTAFQEEQRAVKTFILSITVCIMVPKKSKRKGRRKTLEESGKIL